MRIVSQDGTMDMPYERATVIVAEYNELWAIRASTNGPYELFAVYEAQSQAEREMRRLRSLFQNVEGPAVFQFRSQNTA